MRPDPADPTEVRAPAVKPMENLDTTLKVEMKQDRIPECST